jgi:hypothetical protein
MQYEYKNSAITEPSWILNTSNPDNGRTFSAKPSMYRLFKKKNGELILQGFFEWWSNNGGGGDWEDIETIEED